MHGHTSFLFALLFASPYEHQSRSKKVAENNLLRGFFLCFGEVAEQEGKLTRLLSTSLCERVAGESPQLNESISLLLGQGKSWFGARLIDCLQ